MNAPDIQFVGDDALAIAMPDRESRDAYAEALREGGRWSDIVMGKHHVTVQFDPLELLPSEARLLLADELKHLSFSGGRDRRMIELEMRTDPQSAPDLDRLAAENGMDINDLLDRIAGSDLTVDMLGFTPGFAYIAGLDPGLDAKRLDVPRQRVAPGSVGMIRGQIGLYALQGPGGWPIIGRISEPLFDPGASQPSKLSPGMKVRFRIVRTRA